MWRMTNWHRTPVVIEKGQSFLCTPAAAKSTTRRWKATQRQYYSGHAQREGLVYAYVAHDEKLCFSIRVRRSGRDHSASHEKARDQLEFCNKPWGGKHGSLISDTALFWEEKKNKVAKENVYHSRKSANGLLQMNGKIEFWRKQASPVNPPRFTTNSNVKLKFE